MASTLAGARARRFSPRRVAVVTGLVAALAGAAALVVVALDSSDGATAAVRTATAQSGVVLSTVSGSGNVESTSTIGVNPSSSGSLVELRVRVGQRVEAGAVLARLDPAAARRGVATAQAALDQAEARLALDREGPTAQSLASAQGSVRSAEAALASSRSSLASSRRVVERDVESSGQQLAAADAQLRLDRSAGGPNPQSLTSAESAVASARQQLAASTTALVDTGAVNEQSVAAAQASLVSAELQLANDRSKLADDLQLELHDCGTHNPVIADRTSAQCRSTAQAVMQDEQAVSRDELAVESARAAVTQARVKATQSENQASAQLASAQASLDAATKQLAALRATNTATVEKDERAVDAARAGLAQTRTRGEQTVAQARAQVRSAEISLQNARAALRALSAPASAAQLAQDAASVRTARVQLDTARAALADLTVRAPVAGTVASLGGSVGEVVSGGASGAGTTGSTTPTGLVVLTDARGLVVTLGLPEVDAAKVRAGQPATVTIAALPDTRIAGRVLSTDPAATVVDNVVTYTVTLSLVSPPTTVKPGMTADVEIVVAQRDDAVVVPTAAVTTRAGESTVTVLGAGGTQQQVAVVTGLQGDSTTEIVSGLRPGQQVVLPSLAVSGVPSGVTTQRPGGFGGGTRGGGAGSSR